MADVDIQRARTAYNQFARSLLTEVQPFWFVLVKLASRCNIDCKYCYWFRDAEVYKQPALLTKEAEDAFCWRLEEHINEFGLDEFIVTLHGGEPLLFPKERFIEFQEKLCDIEERTGCTIARVLSTNAMLIDEEWAEILRDYEIDVSVSLDGPAAIHNKTRVDFKGAGTHAGTLRGIEILRAAGVEPSVTAVCHPETDPEEVVSYVVDELGIKDLEILPPDATHSDNPPQIGDYFIKLFDVWYDKYAAQGLHIPALDSMIIGLLGDLSFSETVGIGPVDIVTLMTDGSLEPLDVLRIAGDGSTRSRASVFRNSLQDVQDDPRWREVFDASTHLCDTCLKCEYLDSCGGGHIAQRWSPERGFDNPSVYCESWKRIFEHIWRRISPTLVLKQEASAASPQG